MSDYVKSLNEFFDLVETEEEKLERISEEVLKEYDLAYKRLAYDDYNAEKLGRFGMLKNGDIVEINSYTEPYQEGDETLQELYFTNEYNQTGWAFYDDFLLFAHNDSILTDNPIKFGDLIQLKDIPTSRFLTLETSIQETYDLYMEKIGVVTQVVEETNSYAVAFDREVVLLPMNLVDKLYKREIF